VWHHITDPSRIAGWLMATNFAAEVGRDFSMQCGTQGPITGVVTEVVPHKKLVYTWTSALIKAETTVTITLTDENGKTRLVLVHSGWQVPPTDAEVVDEHDKGWGEHLRSLQDQVAGTTSK
jgi:uncharacterized protein YndB with AHSA1/START domain